MKEAAADHTQHEGVLVALWVPPKVAALLARRNGEPADKLHITLAYCDGSFEDAVPVVAKIAKQIPVLTGRISGTGRFPASESSDGKDVLWAKPVVDELAPFRAKLASALTKAGVIPKSDHAWNPHITLDYIQPGVHKSISVPDLPLRFSALTLKQGERTRTFPLKGAR